MKVRTEAGRRARQTICSLLWGAVERGLRVFFYLLAVMTLFRVLFLWGMEDYLGAQTGWAEIELALWLGLRLSMQTAGLLTAPVWLVSELGGCWSGKLRRLLYRALSGVELVALTIAFGGRFPYYRQFHSGYNQAMFNTVNDDVWALLVSLVEEFNLPLRLAGAMLLAGILWCLLDRWLAQRSFLAQLWQGAAGCGRGLLAAAGAGILYLVTVWTMYGGSLGWQTALEWENIGVTGDKLLNEAMLDDVQAIWRGYTLNHRNLACNGLAFTPEEIQRLAAKMAAQHGRPGLTGKDLDVYLTRQAKGRQIAPPSQIFLIVSESLANWPLLEEYKDLHIADGLRSLKESSEAAYTGAMLPNGAFTVSAVMGLVTGFADANLYLTTMPEAFQAPYPTAAAPVMQRLGYTPRFWYAGPTSWERVEEFALAQGFASFTGRGAFPGKGNVWGVEDEDFYRGILAQLPAGERGFHFILNVSNHAPYTLDLAAAGFPAEQVREALPEEARKNEELLRQLGHYWYADKQLSRFVRELQRRYPDCLIAIVGDHADRYNIEKNPSEYKRLAVPFFLCGKGVKPNLLPPEAAGSQIDIMPTLIELIAPPGFTYEALGDSLSFAARRGVNYGYWITADTISRADTPFQPQDFQGREVALPQKGEELEDYINTIWAISWWRAKNGAFLP